MHIVLGATGHVGSSVATALLDRDEPITVVTRDARRAERFTRRGATVAVADVNDADALGDVLRRGQSAFLLMPSADPATDTVAEERRTVASIVQAVKSAAVAGTLEHVVVQSTYGAQPGDGIGDLGVLYEFEQAVKAIGVRASVVRGAYYMSNWDSALDTARNEGVVQTFFPADFLLPMVAPADLGRAAARLLAEERDRVSPHYVEGPAQYTPADVARAFGQALGRDVRTVEIPRSGWEPALRSFGFSPAAATSYARMMGLTLDGPQRPEAPERGATSLSAYVAALVREKPARAARGA
jgi:uncharacterized protein YbjT (DUF2867 family)